MRKIGSLFSSILVFVLAQVAWFSLLGLWIYWYVSNYIIFENVGENVPPQIISGSTNVFALVSGIVLLVFISIGMSLIFIYLNRQMNITKLYDNFIASVTHELKSPLSSIQLYLETINSRNVPLEKQKEFVSIMMKDTDRLNDLINSILHLSGIEQKKMARKYPHDYQIYKASEIFTELLNNSIDKFHLASESVIIQGNPDCLCVIDSNWFEIVFYNLFDNAIKYSNNNAKIRISLSNTSKKIQIEFSDNGIGISHKDQKKIFNKFQRIENSHSPNVKGTGLGLYWVKEIVKYHGGKIQVFSGGKEKGTTFTITLPIYQTSKKRYIKTLLKISTKNKEKSDKNNGS
ncbi:MAG: HAMP domain-containing histidine kinase [Calditrichia bacterium]|nr:HAMP domain-containing histidine kinase [Calditrichia bacterium]